MAEPDQDWGLILLSNQLTWEIKARKENKHVTYSVLLNTVQKQGEISLWPEPEQPPLQPNENFCLQISNL